MVHRLRCTDIGQVLAQVEFAIRKMRAENIEIYLDLDLLYVVEYYSKEY